MALPHTLNHRDGIKIPSDWTTVWVQSPYTSALAATDWLQEVLSWMKGDEHAGSFAVRVASNDDGKPIAALCFGFSDPDTAFEFKMRWG